MQCIRMSNLATRHIRTTIEMLLSIGHLKSQGSLPGPLVGVLHLDKHLEVAMQQTGAVTQNS